MEDDDDIHASCRADIVLAANLGQSLLAEVETLRQRIKELEQASTSTVASGAQGTTPAPQSSNSTQDHIQVTPRRLPDARRLGRQNSKLLDPALASEIDDALVDHVRQLQYKLAMAESQKAELFEQSSEHEKNLLNMKRQINRLTAHEAKLNERIWEVEGSYQLLKETHDQREAEISRLKSTLRTVQLENATQRELVDSLRSSEQNILVAHDQLRSKLETEAHERRKLNASFVREKSALNQQVQDLMQALESHKIIKVKDAAPVIENIWLPSDDFIEDGAQSLSSKSSPTRQNNTLYLNSLTASLQHSHRQIELISTENAELRLNIAELQQLLVDAQETIESYKVRDSLGFAEVGRPSRSSTNVELSTLLNEVFLDDCSKKAFKEPLKAVHEGRLTTTEATENEKEAEMRPVLHESLRTERSATIASVQMELVDAYNASACYDRCSTASQMSPEPEKSRDGVKEGEDQTIPACDPQDSPSEDTPKATKTFNMPVRRKSPVALSNSSTFVEIMNHSSSITQTIPSESSQQVYSENLSCGEVPVEATQLAQKERRDGQETGVRRKDGSLRDVEIWKAPKRPVSTASDTFSIATDFDSLTDSLTGEKSDSGHKVMDGRNVASLLDQIPHGLPNSNGESSPIVALTATMVGSWFQKFNRHGKRPQLRFFWVEPYSRMLHWAHSSLNLMKSKSAYIEDVLWTELPENYKNYPPNEEHALTIRSENRSIILIPTSWHDHHSWVTGLTLLLSNTNPSTAPPLTPLRRSTKKTLHTSRSFHFGTPTKKQ